MNLKILILISLFVIHLPLANAGIINRVDNVSVTNVEATGGSRVVIESAEPLKYQIKKSANPPWVKVKIKGKVLCEDRKPQMVGKSGVKEIRFVCSKTEDPKVFAKLLKSIDIILFEASDVKVEQREWVLSVKLRPVGATQQKVTQHRIEYQNVPRMTLSVDSNLEDVVQTGLLNHKPLSIARKKLKLEEAKLFSAKRNMFPLIKAKAAIVDGKLLTDPVNDLTSFANYERQEYGVELGQPIYQSGRLYYAVKLANADTKIAQLEIERMSQEKTFDIKKSFYNYFLAVDIVKLQNKLNNEVKEIRKRVKRKKKVGVVSRSDYLAAEAGGEEAAYRVMSKEKDSEIARLNLLYDINLDELPRGLKFSIGEEISLKSIDMSLDLDHLISVALVNRPDLLIASLGLESRQHAENMSKADNALKIDASAFVGESGAAFEGEALNLESSYNVGVRGSWLFGGHSLNPMVSRDKSAPDLGSTSRTETNSVSVDFGILDSLEDRAGLMQSEINREEAEDSLNRARNDVVKEVHEAYFNYQKAVLQRKSSRVELKYRKNVANISREKDRQNRIGAYKFLENLSRESNASMTLKQADVFYLISLAGLEKAVGTKF